MPVEVPVLLSIAGLRGPWASWPGDHNLWPDKTTRSQGSQVAPENMGPMDLATSNLLHALTPGAT